MTPSDTPCRVILRRRSVPASGVGSWPWLRRASALSSEFPIRPPVTAPTRADERLRPCCRAPCRRSRQFPPMAPPPKMPASVLLHATTAGKHQSGRNNKQGSCLIFMAESPAANSRKLGGRTATWAMAATFGELPLKGVKLLQERPSGQSWIWAWQIENRGELPDTLDNFLIGR